ncbi:hypothetical protein ACHAXA_011314 [Cyclostephanos tholiformis]|uniref:dihydrofolate reductase n=1 Tax=Cyclostephanos tholiformis TaxID=382380 RepID=A0ABD3RWB3_9STRA
MTNRKNKDNNNKYEDNKSQGGTSNDSNKSPADSSCFSDGEIISPVPLDVKPDIHDKVPDIVKQLDDLPKELCLKLLFSKLTDKDRYEIGRAFAEAEIPDPSPTRDQQHEFAAHTHDANMASNNPTMWDPTMFDGRETPMAAGFRPTMETFSRCETTIAETNKRPTIGIVAAIVRDGVIGVDGGLPWNSLISLDRDHFVNLTRGRILIIGRKTFANEDPSGAHIGHVRVCIVVSRMMDPSDLVERNGAGIVFPMVKLARSFDEALDVASDEMLSLGKGKCEGRAIECWVAGGERIYREAIRYGASEVHLTHVDF